MITLSWLLLITLAAAVLSIVDGVLRSRGRGSGMAVAIAEIVLGALLLLSAVFQVQLPVGTTLIAVLLEIALVLALVLKGTGRRRSPVLTIVALVANTVLLLLSLGWITIPPLGL